MRIVWCIHLYLPTHACGSETMAHHINKFLISQGHEVRVMLLQAKSNNVKVPYEIDGVMVHGISDNLNAYTWGDVLLTHLDYTGHTIQIGSIVKRPVIQFVHNSSPYQSVISGRGDISVVYNSKWIAETLKYERNSMVFLPPCDPKVYDIGFDPKDNEFITLINLDENKGGFLLKRIAEALPDKKFLAVKGSYSEPNHLGQAINQPPNVTIAENSPDIMKVYRKTRVLLMPSRYESWGRTATEAMCSGIPVVACPTPGLLENCGSAGIFISPREQFDPNPEVKRTYDTDTYDISSFVEAIKKLDDPKYYAKRSKMAKQRAQELDPVNSLIELEQFIINAEQNSGYKKNRSK